MAHINSEPRPASIRNWWPAVKRFAARPTDGWLKSLMAAWAPAPARWPSDRSSAEFYFVTTIPGRDVVAGWSSWPGWPHGQRMRVRARTTVMCRRMVAIELSVCRSGRIGVTRGLGRGDKRDVSRRREPKGGIAARSRIRKP